MRQPHRQQQSFGGMQPGFAPQYSAANNFNYEVQPIARPNYNFGGMHPYQQQQDMGFDPAAFVFGSASQVAGPYTGVGIDSRFDRPQHTAWQQQPYYGGWD